MLANNKQENALGDLIDLAEYKKKKQDSEIEELRRELAAIIEDLGGIHVAPMMMTTEFGFGTQSFSSVYEHSTSMIPFENTWDISGYTYAYEDGKKE